MENQEKTEGGKEGCCSRGRCCGCKAIAALVLLAVGAVGGYFCGRHCGARMCPAPAATAPANPGK